MEHVYFKPWIGENYQAGGIFGKKILVLGEAQVCGGCEECGLKFAKECEEVNTIKTVRLIFNGHKDGWTPTYRKFEKSLVNHHTTLEESKTIWESIAFFNFLQVAMTESRKAGTAEDYSEGRTAFLEVIEELKPELIIVWGTSRLWDNLPGKECGWIDGEKLVIEGKNILNGYYKLSDGNLSRVIAVYHPSSGYSWDLWYKVISSQL